METSGQTMAVLYQRDHSKINSWRCSYCVNSIAHRHMAEAMNYFRPVYPNQKKTGAKQ
jgi:hypothetical protein